MERRPRRPRRRLHHGSYGQLLEDEDLLQQCLGNCGTKDPSTFLLLLFPASKEKRKKDIIAIKVLPATRDKSKTFSER